MKLYDENKFKKFIIDNSLIHETKIDKFLSIIKKKKYILPKSNKQFSFVLQKKYNVAIYYNLLSLVSKFFTQKKYFYVLNHIFKNKKENDINMFKKIYPYIKKNPSGGYNDFILNYTNKIEKFIDTKSIKNYIDFGCGNCKFTESLGKELGLEKSQIFGTDTKDEFEDEWTKNRHKRDITFKFNSEKNPIPFKIKFNLITCMMVLHHIPKNILNKILQSFYDHLEKDGILIIKEHDCWDEYDHILFDLEHSLYIISNAKSIEDINNIKDKIFEQNTNFMNRFEWDYLLQKVGFKLVHYEYTFSSFKPVTSPNRNYTAFYQK